MANDSKFELVPADVEVIRGNLVVALPDDRVIVMPVERLLECAEDAELITRIPDPDLPSDS